MARLACAASRESLVASYIATPIATNKVSARPKATIKTLVLSRQDISPCLRTESGFEVGHGACIGANGAQLLRDNAQWHRAYRVSSGGLRESPHGAASALSVPRHRAVE